MTSLDRFHGLASEARQQTDARFGKRSWGWLLFGLPLVFIGLGLGVIAILPLFMDSSVLGPFELQVANFSDATGPLCGGLITLAFGIFICWVGLIPTEAPQAHLERLRRTGQMTQARVISYRDGGGSRRSKRDPAVEFVLEIALPDQAPYQIEIRAYVPQLILPRLHEMTHIPVLVTPEHRYDLELAWPTEYTPASS